MGAVPLGKRDCPQLFKMKKIIILSLVLLLTPNIFPQKLEKKFNLTSTVDKKSGITWYKHKTNTGSNSRIYLYFGKNNDNQLFVHMVISYIAPEHLWVEKYIFTIDGEEQILIPREKVRHIDLESNRLREDYFFDSSTNQGVSEIYDIMINQEEFDLLNKISRAETVKLKYFGVKGYNRVTIHTETKNALKESITALRELIKSLKK